LTWTGRRTSSGRRRCCARTRTGRRRWRGGWWSGSWTRLSNPAAADDGVVLVKDGGLSGCDGALRLAEADADAGGVERVEGGGGGRVAMAELDFDFDGLIEMGEGEPVDVADFAEIAAEIGVVTNDDAVGSAVKSDNVQWAANGDAQAAALADSEMMHAGVAANDLA